MSLSLISVSGWLYGAEVLEINQPANDDILSGFYTVQHENKHVLTSSSFTRNADLDNKLQPIKATPDMQMNISVSPGGMVTTRYQQLYHDIPIWGKQVITHKEAGTTKVTGVLVKNLDNDIKDFNPKLNKHQAINVALIQTMKLHPNLHTNSNFNQAKLYIYIQPVGKQAKLIYQVTLPGYRYLVDANSGEILQSWSTIRNHQAAGLGGNNWPAYYTSPYQRNNEYQFVLNPTDNLEYGPLEVTSADNGVTCIMTNNDITTHNMQNLTTLQLMEIYGFEGDESGVVATLEQIQSEGVQDLVAEFNCAEGNTDVVNNPAQVNPITLAPLKTYSPLNDSHFFATATKTMLENTFGYNDPFVGHVYVFTHVGELLNAYAQYIPEVFPNQFWVGNGQPDNPDAPFIALSTADVISHELGHLVTSHASNLIYTNQSGGMNEAFSDMSGMAMLQYLQDKYPWSDFPQQFNPQMWVGGAIFTEAPYFLRNMSNPPADGSSIDNVDNYQPGMDPHQSSGIYNKAFYNLATTPNWDINKAYSVMLQANRNYWIPDESFNNGLCGLYNAADSLSYSNADKKNICMAFQPTGVVCSSAPSDCNFGNDNSGGDDNSGLSNGAITAISVVGGVFASFWLSAVFPLLFLV